MTDRIHIKDLSVPCIIGTNPEERVQKQTALVNITMDCDLSAAGKSDAIADTVDYSALKNRIVALMESSSFFLVEKLADEISTLCLSDSRVDSVRVRVDKPGALTFARSVGVEIFRSRADLAEASANDG